jgi:ATP-binding cassette subfamily F protein uup
MKALDAARSKLEAAEEEWLEIEARREALAAG